jgi:hypothetical protein
MDDQPLMPHDLSRSSKSDGAASEPIDTLADDLAHHDIAV